MPEIRYLSPFRLLRVFSLAPVSRIGNPSANDFACHHIPLVPSRVNKCSHWRTRTHQAANVQWLLAEVPETGKQGLIVTELRVDSSPSTRSRRLNTLSKEVDECSPDRCLRRPLETFDERSICHREACRYKFLAQRIVRVPIPSQPSHRQEIRLRWQLTDPSLLAIIASRQSIWLALRPTNAGWQYQRLKLGIVILRIHPQRKARSTSSSRDGVPLTPNFTPQLVVSNFDRTHPLALAFAPAKRNRLWMKRSTSPRASATIRVNYTANVTPGNCGTYRVELSIPENLSIAQITASETDKVIPLRGADRPKIALAFSFPGKVSAFPAYVGRHHAGRC